MSSPVKTKHNLNQGVAGVVSLGTVGKELFRIISVMRWKHCRDNITQFFLLVALYKTHLEAESSSNVGKKGGVGKYRALEERVESLKKKMKQIQREEDEESAKRFSELVLAEMKDLLANEAQLQPQNDRFFNDHWDKAEILKQKFTEKKSKERSDSGSISSSRRGSAITLNVRINVGDPRFDLSKPWERQLTFPSYFRDSLLSTLVPYALARNDAGTVQGERGLEQRRPPPIKRKPMDALYVRSIDTSKRATWKLIDRKMTIKNFERWMREDPTVEVRFISCKIRFVLLATYSSGRTFERIVDLDKDRKQLMQLIQTQGTPNDRLIQEKRPTGARSLETAQSPTRRQGNGDLFKTLQPQACIFLLGDNPLMTSPEEFVDKGCQCTVC